MAKFQKVDLSKLKKSTREIKYIVVHCSATNPAYDFNAKDIDSWHRKKGWNEIGYNYVVKLDGTIEEGRDVNKIPAQVEGYNANAIGFVYIGGINSNQLAKDTRTAAQKASMKALVKSLKVLYPKAKVQGHRDFPKVKKACPCFDAIPEYSNV